MTEEEQRQEVAVWGENMNLMKDCSLEKTDEDMYYNSEWKWRDKSRIRQVKYRKRNLCALAELCNEHIIQ